VECCCPHARLRLPAPLPRLETYDAVFMKRCTKSPRARLPAGGVILVVAVALICSGCDRHVHVTKEMAWECLPAEREIAKPVRFRYVEDPEYFDVVSGQGLCQRLQASAKRTAQVTYEVWGNSFQGLHGYRIESIDGQPVQNIDGPARSGQNVTGHGNLHPLTTALK
jgi:hypothetical protein